MKLTLSLMRLSGKLAERLEKYGRYHPSPLTIQHIVEFGKRNSDARKSFAFLRKEIPVRLANIMNEISLQPSVLRQMPSVQEVAGWYEQSFEEVMEFEDADPENVKNLENFSERLDQIQRRHLTVVETMAHGLMEMKDAAAAKNMSLYDVEGRVQYFLDRFYLMRISIRLLIHQHLLVFSGFDDDTHVGCFNPACDVLSIARDAYENARYLCADYYKTAPECHFRVLSPYDTETGANITMTYIPAHLYYMLFELIKNALRAVVEFHANKPSLPPIKLLICKGREDVSFRLSDEGGGVSRNDVDRLFRYMYSTAPRPPSPNTGDSAPLAGYGYGLPIARLYAKYFNGNLILNSVDGHGTDAVIFLKVFPRDALELLPVHNRTSTQYYVSAERAADWSEPSGLGRI